MMFRAVLLLLAIIFPVLAEDHALVRVTDFWRYQPVPTNAPPQEPNWNSVGYNDSTWTHAIASFTSPVGGGPGWAEASFLPWGYSTILFRKAFNISDPDFIRWLSLRVNYESGFVAYLNGSEVARRGFPTTTGPVPFDATPTNRPRDFARPTEVIDISHGIPLLQPGTNVLAIQLHNAGEANRNLLLIAELLANFTRGPFIQNTTTNSTQLIWHTQRPSTGFVLYGPDLDHLMVALVNDLSTVHAITLRGLEPGQPYIYRVVIEEGSSAAVSDWASFRTLKAPGSPATFLVFGDSGQASVAQYNIAARMRGVPADLVLHTGDVLYPGFTVQLVDTRCFSIYRDQMRSVPFFFCLGNHDEYGKADYLASFYLPTNTVTRTEEYYSFDHGDVHFVALATDTHWAGGQRYHPGSPQYEWLEADLKATKQPWKVIWFHHVFRSSSIHTADDYLVDGTYDKYQLQASIGALAEKYGVQLILNGHDHDFERFAPFRGVNSIVSGGGGASLYGQIWDPSKSRHFIEEGSMQFYMRHNFLRVTVNGEEMQVDAIDDSGTVFDRFYRSKAGGGSTPYSSVWAPAVVETVAGADVAGNIPGQTFDFNDPGIPTFSGSYANLGRAHVRNDREFLYIGLESVTLHEYQALALFVENIANPGVPNLAGLGNHQIDPEGQGVDGLDILAGLSFKNFRPKIGCLLGDEFADGTFRSFKRAQMNWAAGQGAFQLASGFPNVTGAKIQQFNRSPQGPPVLGPESNADLIEVALPWSALGPNTGTVRIAALVLGPIDPGTSATQVDTAFLGQSLAALPEGGALLEPIIVQLAPDPDPYADAFAFRGVLVAPRKIRFTWNSVSGVSYKIQSTPALGIPFEDLAVAGLPVIASGAESSFELSLDAVTDPRFFRLARN